MLLWALLTVPAAGAALSVALRRARVVLTIVATGVLCQLALGAYLVRLAFSGPPLEAAQGWLRLDPLSAYHVAVMLLVFTLASVYAHQYFDHEIRCGSFNDEQARRFGALWFGALDAMMLVLLSNHLGLMWVGVEATTVVTAFLICIHKSQASLEATWKYVLICSVGIALAFLGTLLVGAAAANVSNRSSDELMWTDLRTIAVHLNPQTMKLAFIFLLVGYGTKVGLAPLHTWLPDAHSQAPAPVSAIFSGFMLNTALYCIMRFVPIVEAATGRSGFARHLLLILGVISMLIAAAFILFQHDIKRLLAYHSVEHLGIISIGLGLGGLGTFAALFHTLNHSLCKTVGFLSAGRLGQAYGTHDMECMPGTLRRSPVWGSGFFISLLALVGMAPFAVFMSEIQIVKAAADQGAVTTLSLFLGAAAVVFVGALSHAMSVAWGEPPAYRQSEPNRLIDATLVAAPLVLLLVLGVWMPPAFRSAIEQARAVLEAGP